MTTKAYNFQIGNNIHTLLSIDKALIFEAEHKEEITNKFESIIENNYVDLEEEELSIEDYNVHEVILIDSLGKQYHLEPVYDSSESMTHLKLNNVLINHNRWSYNLQKEIDRIDWTENRIEYLEHLNDGE